MFERPTLQEINDRIISDIQTRIEGGESLLRRSSLRVLGRANAGAFHLQYGFLLYMADQMFASTAESTYLERHGVEFGIYRKAATYATGETRATGTNGITIPAGTRLQSPDGQQYSVDTGVTIAAGIADLSVTAIVGGDDGNQSAATTLTFISPIAGVNTSTTVDSNAITGGVDEEDDEDLRDRILSRKRQPPHGGAEFDYEAWALEVAGVTRAWTFPLYNGMGTVGLAFVRDNDPSSIIPTDEQLEEVREYIEEHIDPSTGDEIGLPIGAQNALFMITLTRQDINFEIDIYPNTAAIQANIEAALEDLIIAEGGPGETIYLSEINAAISSAAGLVTHRLDSPSADIGIAVNKIPVMGSVTYGNY